MTAATPPHPRRSVYSDHQQATRFLYTEARGAIAKVASSAATPRPIVASKTKSTSDIVLVPYSQAYEEGFEDMPRRIPDLTKIKGLIGYEPKVGLDGILDRVIEHFMTDKGRI